MLTVDITLNYLFKHKLKFLIYCVILGFTYPFESLVMSKIISELSQVIPKFKTKKDLVIKLIIYLCICWTIVKLAEIAKHIIEDYIFPKFYLTIRKYFFDNIITRYKQDYKDVSIGDFISNMILIPYALRQVLLSIISVFIPSILTIIILNIYFFRKNRKLFGLTILAPVVACIIYYLVGKRCIVKSRGLDSAFTRLNESTKDKLSNLFSIYTNNNVDVEIKEYAKLEQEFLKINMNTRNCNNVLFTCLNISSIIFYLAILMLLFTLLKNKKIDSKTVVTCLIMLTYYFVFIKSFSKELPHINSNIGQLMNAEKFMKHIEEKAVVTDPFKKNKINDVTIDVENISFRYSGNAPNIIDNKSFKIKNNENIGIFGKSGSGKTTFIKLLMRFHKLNKGSIKIDNKDIYKYNIDYLRDNMSYVNQNTKLFNKTVLENIKYGLDVSNDEIYEFIKNNNIDIFNKLNNGLDENVGIDGNKVSGGQKQVILLIKAFLRNSKIYILDEPTTGLDKNIKTIILNLIKRLSKNKTVIIISHDHDVEPIIARLITFS